MSKPNFMPLAALTALTALGATLLVPPAHAAGPASGPAAVPAGMVVVRDPQTGQLRAPTGAESNALLGNAARQRSAPSARVESVGPGGSRKVQLGKSALVYSVATRHPDGTLTEHCVNGEEAAHATITTIAQPTRTKEPRHESE